MVWYGVGGGEVGGVGCGDGEDYGVVVIGVVFVYGGGVGEFGVDGDVY